MGELLAPAFMAGLLTFLAPCTLPLVPGYLGFISGVSLDDLQTSEKAARLRLKIFLNGLLFVLGFSLVFIFFGTAAGLAGRGLLPYRIWLTRIAGVFVIIFGLFMLGVLRIPFLARARRLRVPALFKRGKPMSSLVLGAAFGFGWTPCVGPILGSILFLASTAATAGQGALLLAIFSLGLAVPFLTIALGIGSASAYLAQVSRYLHVVSVVGGIFLVLLGILLVTGKTYVLIAYGYRLFNFIQYDRLLNYL
ncbi:sulfite exporter TauE/SafE family protein [Candidatus Parcubacteria bacterium]|nr:sulfite exporter TauE/SafE family protein [Candidatus Parcubacteria bacterium]